MDVVCRLVLQASARENRRCRGDRSSRTQIRLAVAYDTLIHLVFIDIQPAQFRVSILFAPLWAFLPAFRDVPECHWRIAISISIAFLKITTTAVAVSDHKRAIDTNNTTRYGFRSRAVAARLGGSVGSACWRTNTIRRSHFLRNPRCGLPQQWLRPLAEAIATFCPLTSQSIGSSQQRQQHLPPSDE